MVNVTTTRLAALGLATALGTAGMASAPASATESGCSTGSLPKAVLGSPAVKAGGPLGFYLGHGSNGFTLRVTHANKHEVVLSGKLVASSVFSNVTRVKLEKGDAVALSSDKKTLTFRFHNYGAIDGINFAAGCSKRMRVELHVGRAAATTRQVFLGAHAVSPTSVPFTIQRTG